MLENVDQLLADLDAISPLTHKLRALGGLGVNDGLISEATQVGSRTLRRWKSGSHEMRASTAKSMKNLDNLRQVVRIFVLGDVPQEIIAPWLGNRTDIAPDYPRPVDLINNDPDTAIQLARNAVMRFEK